MGRTVGSVAPNRAQNDAGWRVASVDTVRGLLVLLAFAVLLGQPALREWPSTVSGDGLLRALEPSRWNGATLADLVMPGFLFIMGLSAGLSVDRRRQTGASATEILRHLACRSLGLFALGLVLDGGLPAPLVEIRWLGPFQRIAICNFLTGALCLVANSWGRLLVAALLIVNYGLAFEAFPPEPPESAGRSVVANHVDVLPISERNNLAADVDRRWLPGRKYFGDWDPCGLLTTLPALGLALLGAAASTALRRLPMTDVGRTERWSGFAVGLILIMAGLSLGDWQPLNSMLLTTPFVLFTVGLCVAALCVADICGRFRPMECLTSRVGRFGRSSLVLMVVLHLAQRAAPHLVRWSAGAIDARAGDLHSLLATMTITALLLITQRRAGTLQLDCPEPPPDARLLQLPMSSMQASSIAGRPESGSSWNAADNSETARRTNS